MRIVLRRAALTAAIVAFAFSWTPFASGIENESFGLTPFPERVNDMDRRSFSIPLETGATFEDAVRIYNRTDEPVTLAVYATDAETALDDTIKVGLREENATGVGSWIDLALPSVKLEARDAKTVTFRVRVRSSDPSPDLGAIVVENTAGGLSTNAVQRLHILVRTVPPNTPTASVRVRTFLLRSPWVAIALLGLVVAGALVWVGARRARRPRDLVVEPGSLDASDEFGDDAPEASRPVIKRLGASASEGAHAPARSSVLDRVRASAQGSRKRDERPLLDDVLIAELDAKAAADAPSEDEEPPARTPTPKRARSAAASSKPKAKAVAAKPKPMARTSRPKSASPKPKPQKPTSKPKPAKRTGARSSAPKKGGTKAKPRPSAKKAKATQDGVPNFIPLTEL
jgi:hypothetical protein